MARAKKRSWLFLTLIAGLLIGAALAAAFWPRALMVDLGEVTRGPMMVTIDGEGRTRVAEAYVVSTPVTGRLLRVEVDPGDVVERGETVVARMLPSNPAALDIRTREQAMAAVQRRRPACASPAPISTRRWRSATSRRPSSSAPTARQIASEAALDRARQAFRVAQASIETSKAAISMRQAELANVRARLIGFDDQGLAAAIGGGARGDEIPLHAPADGRILRVMQQSETTLPAGTPIGDVGGALEIVVELI